MERAILILSCPDTKGIVAAISGFISENNGNIEHSDQHIDSENSTLFMRVEWVLKDFYLPKEEISGKLSGIAGKFNMNWNLYFSSEIPRVAIFVSKHTHCLYDLLFRYKAGQFPCRIPVIFSNHPFAREIAEYFGMDYREYCVGKDNKRQQEDSQLKELADYGIELIVLARYMQILTGDFVDRFNRRIINVHHSFLPAFAGKMPYRQAYQRGVKLIGATSHYVTKELDSGPIIDQDVVRISHRDLVRDLRRKGQDLEKLVLSRAVKWHLERKVLVYNNKTVVFD